MGSKNRSQGRTPCVYILRFMHHISKIHLVVCFIVETMVVQQYLFQMLATVPLRSANCLSVCRRALNTSSTQSSWFFSKVS